MKSGIRIITMLLIVVALVSTGWAAPVKEKPIVWNMAHFVPSGHYIAKLSSEFAQRVTERSGGKLVVRWFPGGTLVSQMEMTPSLIAGDTQLGVYPALLHPEFIPLMSVFELPFPIILDGVKDISDLKRIFESFHAASTRLDVWKYFSAMVEEKLGLHPLWCERYSGTILFSLKPIRRTEEWRGVKVRTYSRMTSDIVSAIGGTPVMIRSGEVYTALETGMVDAITTAFVTGGRLGWWEVMKYANLWPLTGGLVYFGCANKKAWDALPNDLRVLIEKVLEEMKMNQQMLTKSWEGEAMEAKKARKMQLVPVSVSELRKARELVKPVYRKWLNSVGSEGAEALKTLWGSELGKEFLSDVMKK